jgi:glycine betaine/choline ABC-type transport system substrate-binding protein
MTDPDEVYSRTRGEYEEKFDLTLSPPIGFSNDFAILIRGETAREQNLKTISDAVPVSAGWTAGFGQDFMSREDGYPGFVKAYGFRFARQPREMDLSLTYRALAAREVDIIAGNSTDGLIGALDLYQLSDDKHYFPPYQAVFIARKEVLQALSSSFRSLANAITTDEMRRMNLDVDAGKRRPNDVAADWLKQHPQ